MDDRRDVDKASPCAELHHANPAASWRTDVSTARRDLEATGAQAFVLAAHACAWRLAARTAPLAMLVAGGLIVLDAASGSALLLAAVLGALGPHLLAMLLTFPVAGYATLQAWHRGSPAARGRFGLTGLVYLYYGWRYAFRGRRRPWAAVTRAEQVVSNPDRAGVGQPRIT